MLKNLHPEAERILKCLNAVSEAGSANVTEVSMSTGINRNTVSVLLNSFEGIGLVEANVKGRSEVFSLTPRAENYMMAMNGDFSYSHQKISDIITELDKFGPELARGLVKMTLKHEAVRPPLLDKINRIRLELETLVDAFCLAGSGFEKNSPERKVVEEVTNLLRLGNTALVAPSKKMQKLGKQYLEKARDILESVAKAKELADKLELEKVSLEIEEIGKDERGRPIFRVK